LRNHVVVDAFDPGPQPAGRTPAPGRLGLVQAFANSFWDLDRHGEDEWPDADGYRAWLIGRGFAAGGAGEGERAEAIGLREAIRALAYRNHDGRPPGPELAVLDRAAAGAPVALRFDPVPRHAPLGDGHSALVGLVLGVIAEAMGDGSWRRLKACPGPDCGWLFYDASRNLSSQWCSMRLCGNRVKGQRFRSRRGEHLGE
jgi:predicted RNA-binding Zn ribbon-like protein